MKQCKLCTFKIKNQRSYAGHVKKVHNKTLEEVDLEYLLNNIHLFGVKTQRNILLYEAKYKCVECGFNKTRKNGRTILEMDHIDGDHTNKKRNNLRILCPNCHALTHTFRNNKRIKKKPISRDRKPRSHSGYCTGFVNQRRNSS